MADHEIRLVSKILREKDLQPVLSRGISVDWFVNPQARMMFETIRDHYESYSVVPTVATMKDRLPGCTVLDVRESYDYLIDAFVEWRQHALTQQALKDAAAALESGDASKARDIMARVTDVESLGVVANNDVDLTQTVDDRIEEYVSRRTNPVEMLGLPTGFPTIDKATLGLQPGQLVTIIAPPKTGKAQPLTTPVLTPTGWRKMGDLAAGDLVIGADGVPTEVVAVHERGVREVYRITLDDGGTTTACADHLWTVNPHGRQSRTVDTETLRERIRCDKRWGYLPVLHPHESVDVDLPVDPYLLGVLLGDGGLSDGTPRLTTADSEILESVTRLIEPLDMVASPAGSYGFRLRKRVRSNAPNPLTRRLELLGVVGLHSWEKHIPEAYLFASPAQRLALLQGLMDTDGGADGKSLTVCTTSQEMAAQVQQLVWSLGGTARVKSRRRHYTKSGVRFPGRVAYVVTLRLPATLTPFRLTRKIDAYATASFRKRPPTRRVVSVDRAGAEEVRCITVASPDGLYVTEDFIVTHNSTLATAIAKNLWVAGHVPLLISYEMSNPENAIRVDSMVTRLSKNRLNTGRIDDREEKTLRRRLGEMKGKQPFYIINDRASTATVPMVKAKAEQYKPSVLLVDGVYMMRDNRGESNTPQALTNITRSLKETAQQLGIPIVESTQVLLQKLGKDGRVTAASIGYCVDEATEILTNAGWRTYDRVAPGDVVLTLNHTTGKSEWQPLLAVNVFPAQPRKMCSMEGKAHSSLTTLQHRWPVKHLYSRRNEVVREWTTTERLNSCDYIITAAECGHLPTEPKHTDALVELVAWFWTEGHIIGKYGNVGITQSHAVNADNVQRIISALHSEFGPEWRGPIPRGSNSRSDGVPRWRAPRDERNTNFWLSVDAGRRLLELSPNKIPSWEFLQSLTKAQLHLFIKVSMLADNNGRSALSQKSREAAEAFQFACTLAGINTSLLPSSGMWRVGMKRRQVVTPIAAARQGRRFTLSTQDYDGIIWCPTTPNQTWLARRNGTVYFTGNSSSFFQDSDVLLALQRVDDDEDTDNERILRVEESRNCGKVEATLMWDWESGTFREFEEDERD